MEIKNVVKNLVELQKLENRYGWQSCMVVPEAYDRMEILSNHINDDLKEIEACQYSRKDLREILESIASDISNGNLDLDEMEITHYTQDDYIETYVVEGMDESARNMFDSLFYFMNSDDRNHWLNINHVAQDPGAYATKWVDHIIIVTEY